MDRHVIKGRGPNRGKYLCHARRAPQEKPTSDGYVWLPDQRKAARWPDPRRGPSWATDRALVHDGYFVKLVPPARITVEAVDKAREFISAHAERAEKAHPCHWFAGGFDFSYGTFCRPCAEWFVRTEYKKDPQRFRALYGQHKTAAERYRAAIDGGFDIEHDSPPFCSTCGGKLAGALTTYGADELLRGILEDPPDVNDVEGWYDLNLAIANMVYDDPRWRKIVSLVETVAHYERACAMALGGALLWEALRRASHEEQDYASQKPKARRAGRRQPRRAA